MKTENILIIAAGLAAGYYVGKKKKDAAVGGVTQKLLKEYDFSSIEDYFYYILESRINGNFSQVENLIKDLSRKQKAQFINWCDSQLHYSASADSETDYKVIKQKAIMLLGGIAGIGAAKKSNYWDPNIKRYIQQVASKLVESGLTPSAYTKEKAKYHLREIVAPVWGSKMVDGFSPEIKEAMRKMKSKSISGMTCNATYAL